MNAPRRITSTPERPWQPGAAPVRLALALANPDGSRVVVAANPGAEPRELVLRVGMATVALAVPAQAFETLVFGA